MVVFEGLCKVQKMSVFLKLELQAIVSFLCEFGELNLGSLQKKQNKTKIKTTNKQADKQNPQNLVALNYWAISLALVEYFLKKTWL